MVTTASSADPQSRNINNNNNNNPSSSSSSMAHHHQEDDEDDERGNPKLTSTLKLPQRSRTSHITTSKFTTSSTTNTINNDILPKFSSLPCFNVKWGRQFRCVSRIPNRSPPPSPHNGDEDDGGILAMREKLMLDFRTQVQQIQADFIHNTHNHTNNINTHQINDDVNYTNHTNNNDTSTNNDNGADKRPWNLRTRRAVCKDPNGGGGVERKPTSSPVKFTDPTQSPLKPNGVNNGDSEVLPSSSRTRRKKFSPSLSKKEIDEDFIAMGAWPAKRPKKRPKLVQRQIDGIFPGYWLSEITAKMYKVNEHP